MMYSFNEFDENSFCEEDFWNEHKRAYEVRFNGVDYIFTPDSIGYADGRVSVKIWSSDTGEQIILECYRGGWRYYEDRRWNDIMTHIGVLMRTDLPLELRPILEACLKKDKNYFDGLLD